MNKLEFIRKLAVRTGRSQESIVRIAQESIELIKDNIKDEMKEDRGAEDFKLRIRGFGTFYVTTTSAKTGRNLKTGEPVKIPSRRVLKFRMSKTFKEEINRK